jgi:hypothetical protein
MVACAQSGGGEMGGESEDQPAGADAGAMADAARAVTSMFVHTSDTLYIVDDANFALIEVGAFDSDNNMMDMAVTPDGELYTISFNAVYRIDQDTASASHVVDVPTGNVGMTFLPDGTLLAADNAGGVRVIDPVSGAITEVGSFGNGYALAGDLVAVANGTMYGIADEGPAGTEDTSNVLLQVDTSTGAATAIGPIGYAGVFGVAVANDHVYAFTRDGEIVEIDPDSGAGTLVRSYPGISFWGAGVTPQAVID